MLKRNVEFWKSQDKGEKIDEEDISFLESELLKEKEEEEENNKKGKKEDEK